MARKKGERSLFIHLAAIQFAEVTVSMHPHGAYMRQLLVQRKMLKLKDPTVALLAKSRQWRESDKFRRPESRGRIAWSVLAGYADHDSGVRAVRVSAAELAFV